MRRLLVVLVVVAMLGQLAAPVAALSTPNTTSADLDVAFIDGSNNLKYVDDAGNVADLGVQADRVGGAVDYDGDGLQEVIYEDQSNNIQAIDHTDGSATTIVSLQGIKDVSGVADWDGDGNVEVVALLSGSPDDLLQVDLSNGNTAFVGDDNTDGIGDIGDYDGDGNQELLASTASIGGNGLVLYESGGFDSTIASSSTAAGGIADVDGDGLVEAVYVNGSTGNVHHLDRSNGDTDTGVSANQIGGIGDINAQGDEEIAIGTGSGIERLSPSGTAAQLTAASVTDVGAVANVDQDGGYDETPTVSNPSPTSTTVSSQTVTLSVDVNDEEFAIGDSVTVQFSLNGNSVGSDGLSSNGTASTSATPQDGSNTWEVTATDSDGNSVTQSYSFTGDYDAPSLSNPEPTGSINTYDGDVSIDVTDSEFPQGDSVTVSATDSNGDDLGSTTLNSNGTATLSYAADAGTNTISWTAEDSHGVTATASQSFDAPNQLTIYNVSNQSQVVTGANATVQLFRAGNSTVIQRQASSGLISLGGLPADATYVVQVDADGYEPRRTLLRNVFEQQAIYLIPDDQNTTTHIVEFSIEDRTGEFDERAELQILRPLNATTNLEYDIVGGDRIGSQEQVKVNLENGIRYRIRISTPDGSAQRVLGAFVPRSDRIVSLKIGQLTFDVATGRQTYNITAATQTNSNGTVTAVQWAYEDPKNLTSGISISFQTADGQVLANQSTTGEFGTYSATQPVNASFAKNHTFVVEYSITRNGSTIAGQSRPGVGQYSPGVPLADGLKQIFSVGFLLVVGGLFSAQNARVGAVITPVFASGLWYFDWLPPGTSVLAITLALGVGVLYNVRRQP